jgi:quinol monooxygenase YgiN
VGGVLGRAVVAQGNPAKVDEVVAYVRDRVQPLVDSLPGSHGLSMFANRETGLIVVNSVWADEAALAASDAKLKASRQEAITLLEAPEVEIHVLEPAVIFQNEPDRPGFWARAAEVEHAPERMDEAITGFRDVALPAMRERFAGINTIALLVNRETGYCVANITYTSREAMDASRAEAERMRSENLRAAGAELLGVRELELVIVGIRPPVDLPAQGRPVEFPSSTKR